MQGSRGPITAGPREHESVWRSLHWPLAIKLEM